MNASFVRGVNIALVTACISGAAVFLNKFAAGSWADSSAFTTSRNLVTVMFLIGLVAALKKFGEMRRLSRNDWLNLVLLGFIGGSIPFLMFFKALTLIPASEAAFIHKSLFLWVALFSYPFLRERLTSWQIAALGLFAAGIFISGAPGSWSFGIGFWLMLGATLLYTAQTVIAKIVLAKISPVLVGWGRMFFGSLFLLAYLVATGGTQNLLPASYAEAGGLAISGAVLFGYVSTWYWALKHAPATVVTSILVVGAPITASLEALLVTHRFPVKLVLPSLLMILGIALIAKRIENILSKLRSR